MTTVAVFPLALVRTALEQRRKGRRALDGTPVAAKFRPFTAEETRTIHCGRNPLAGVAYIRYFCGFAAGATCYIDQQGGQHWPA